MSLKIVKEFSKAEKSWNVELIGELDILTSVDFKKSLNDMLDEMESNIKLNCENLFYIDSTGLGVIIGLLNRVKSNNFNISIINAQANIDKLIKISGLDKVIEVEKTS
ncbi:STAS domain-containing protein [Acidaminobacter sp. JC074]|uniref:STAS domain-containing protein n=1 Tax=Acidaminobacter sp. JC074 TaxID=2530199 RepID=UPI001F0E6F5C|nr:STAS domain-containing protein [Acidaminobacter sp. JC074]MCH4891221.1 STAS domain-containing protein [Acidaminobacter sp. JC074]